MKVGKNKMEFDKDKIIMIIGIALVIVFGIWFITSILKHTNEGGGVCILKDEYLEVIEKRSIIHRTFCFEKELEPLYPEIKVEDCKGFCYQTGFLGACVVDMDNYVWCKDNNQEIKKFAL